MREKKYNTDLAMTTTVFKTKPEKTKLTHFGLGAQKIFNFEELWLNRENVQLNQRRLKEVFESI